MNSFRALNSVATWPMCCSIYLTYEAKKLHKKAKQHRQALNCANRVLHFLSSQHVLFFQFLFVSLPSRSLSFCPSAFECLPLTLPVILYLAFIILIKSVVSQRSVFLLLVLVLEYLDCYPHRYTIWWPCFVRCSFSNLITSLSLYAPNPIYFCSMSHSNNASP